MRRDNGRLSIFVIVGLMAFLLTAAGPTSAQEPEPTASPTSDPSPTPSGEGDPSASPTAEPAESETSESEASSTDASEAEAEAAEAEAEAPPNPCETVDCSPPETGCPNAAPELCDTPDLRDCFSSTSDSGPPVSCDTPGTPDLSECFSSTTTSAVVAPELCPLPGADPVDLAELLDCIDTDPYANTPWIGTLTITGYGGVDPKECRISSTGGLGVRVCLENFGVPVPGTCMPHKQEGPSMPAVCTPGIWQTVASAEALGVAHSDPLVILDPMDCWVPPPAPG